MMLESRYNMDSWLQQFMDRSTKTQLFARAMQAIHVGSEPRRSSEPKSTEMPSHDVLVAKLNRHIARAKNGGKGHPSKKAFCKPLRIDPSEFYRWQRGKPTKAPSYKRRIEEAIAALPD
jgi:hypothetical protein